MMLGFALIYCFVAVTVALIVAETDAEFDWTENQLHMAASLVCAALWPLFVLYMVVYRARRKTLLRRREVRE